MEVLYCHTLSAVHMTFSLTFVVSHVNPTSCKLLYSQKHSFRVVHGHDTAYASSEYKHSLRILRAVNSSTLGTMSILQIRQLTKNDFLQHVPWLVNVPSLRIHQKTSQKKFSSKRATVSLYYQFDDNVAAKFSPTLIHKIFTF